MPVVVVNHRGVCRQPTWLDNKPPSDTVQESTVADPFGRQSIIRLPGESNSLQTFSYDTTPNTPGFCECVATPLKLHVNLPSLMWICSCGKAWGVGVQDQLTTSAESGDVENLRPTHPTISHRLVMQG